MRTVFLLNESIKNEYYRIHKRLHRFFKENGCLVQNTSLEMSNNLESILQILYLQKLKM